MADFPGFQPVRYTQVPNEIFDRWLPELSGWELKALLYICRRTFGFRRHQEVISIAEMIHGTDHDQGTGITRRATLIEALRGLRDRGLIEVTGDDGKAKSYRLRFAATCTESVHPLPGTENGPGTESGPGPGTESVPTPGTENGPGQPGINKRKTEEKDKEKDRRDSSLSPDAVRNTDSVHPHPDALALAERLRTRILGNKADARVPEKLDKWADVFRLMIERDKRSPERIAAAIDWCQAESFWIGNILSADNLRKHFDRIELQMQRPKRGAPHVPTHPDYRPGDEADPWAADEARQHDQERRRGLRP